MAQPLKLRQSDSEFQTWSASQLTKIRVKSQTFEIRQGQEIAMADALLKLHREGWILFIYLFINIVQGVQDRQEQKQHNEARQTKRENSARKSVFNYTRHKIDTLWTMIDWLSKT